MRKLNEPQRQIVQITGQERSIHLMGNQTTCPNRRKRPVQKLWQIVSNKKEDNKQQNYTINQSLQLILNKLDK